MQNIGAFIPLIVVFLIFGSIIYFFRKKGKLIKLGLNFNNYKEAKKLNNTFNISLYILLIIWMCVLLADLFYAFTFSEENLYNHFFIDTIIGILAIIYTISFFVVHFMGAIWIYRVNYNARCLGAKDMRHSPGWSIAWYFIPIAFFWKPYQAMKEIYLKTYNLNTSVSKTNNVPGFFPLWWTFWLLCSFAAQIQFRLGMNFFNSNSLDLYLAYNFVAICADTLLILNWIFFYKVFKSISSMQEYLYNETKTS